MAVEELRADARRNRDQIIAAAREMFSERGLAVPMEEIARRAAVGVGTLYRRFRDRDALLRAVLRENFESVIAEARAARGAAPTPWDALVQIMHQSTRFRMTMKMSDRAPEIKAVLLADPEIARLRREALGILDEVISAAQAEGTLRADVGLVDVTVLFSSVLHQGIQLREAADELAPYRCLAIMLDGLRADRANSGLPGRPLTKADLELS